MTVGASATLRSAREGGGDVARNALVSAPCSHDVMPYPFRGWWSDEVVVWFGKRLRSERHRASLTQRQLERLSGVDQSTISRIENGQRRDVRLVVVARLFAGIESTGRAGRPTVAPRPADDGHDLSHL